MTIAPLRSRVEQAPTLTVSFEVTLGGDTRYHDAMHILDQLRDLTGALTTQGPVHLELTPVGRTVEPVTGAGAVGDEVPDDATIRILPQARQVLLGGRPVMLTRIEFDLLLFLAENPQRVFSRAQLLQQVWGYAHGGDRTVDVHIRRLRAKLGEVDRDIELVTTLRGIGYRLADDVDIAVVRLP